MAGVPLSSANLQREEQNFLRALAAIFRSTGGSGIEMCQGLIQPMPFAAEERSFPRADIGEQHVKSPLRSQDTLRTRPSSQGSGKHGVVALSMPCTGGAAVRLRIMERGPS